MLIERPRDVLKKYSSSIVVRDFIRKDFDFEVSCCDKYITT